MIDFKVIILIILAVLFLIRKLGTLFIRNLKIDKQSAFIVVLGDIGRSPRMNYHALSLANLGYRVTIIGYTESKQMSEILSNSNIQIVQLNAFPKNFQVRSSIVQYGIKVLFLSMSLLFTLIIQEVSPKFILVQNPPSVPTLGVVYLFCKLVCTKFVIDWHNYGFTILSLSKGENSILVKICKKFEILFGQKSDVNFCVTEAMKKDLLEKYKIEAITMHDKAHERFKELNIQEKHEFYEKLHYHYGITDLINNAGDSLLTEVENGIVKMKSSRPAILVSSSSWTDDEDFHLLVDALEIYQNKINESNSDKPDIVCMLTGKGPLKEYYQKLFKTKNFSNIKVNFLWLEPSDYPILLGCADLGICFHKSSSNLDLPMKVVDMFGTNLPVCAFEFACISELVKENENGLLFTDGKQLADHFLNLLSNLNENSRLDKFRKNLQKFTNWNEEWSSVVESALLEL